MPSQMTGTAESKFSNRAMGTASAAVRRTKAMVGTDSTWPACRVEVGGVAGQDQDQRQVGHRAHGVQADQRRHLAVLPRTEGPAGHGVIDEAADSRGESTQEQDEVLPDELALAH